MSLWFIFLGALGGLGGSCSGVSPRRRTPQSGIVPLRSLWFDIPVCSCCALDASGLCPRMSAVKQQTQQYRIGIGFDSHRFSSSPKRKLKLGGVPIPYPQGLAGHSDADVLLHAVADALLGALALPDIGTQFPNTDPKYRNADSAELLKKVVRLVVKRKYRVANLDCIVVCDRPKLTSHVGRIRGRIAELLDISPEDVGLQAKTCEGTMLAIPGKSIAAFVSVLLSRGPERGH